MSSVNSVNHSTGALKTKPIVPVNKTEQLVKDHLESEKKTTGMTKEEVDAMFNMPAEVVNSIQIITTPAFVRMAFSEKDGSQKPHFRAIVAFDYIMLFKMKEILDNTCARLIEQSNLAAEAQQAEEKKENAANTDQAKTGVDITA